MSSKQILITALLLVSIQVQTFFGPIIKFYFQNQAHCFTVNTTLYPQYNYQDLLLDIAIEFNLAIDKIEAQDLNTRIYLNLYSYEQVKNLRVEKPLALVITQRPSPKPENKSIFDFLGDDLV